MNESFEQRKAKLDKAIFEAERAEEAYNSPHPAAMGKGLFENRQSAYTRIGEALMEYLDDGHFMHLHSLWFPGELSTHKGTETRIARYTAR